MTVSEKGRVRVPREVLEPVRSVCALLPEVVEEQAWVGTRWTVSRHNFAHVVHIAEGWPPAYARAAGTSGPCNVLTFRSTGLELEALGSIGHPYFRPVWGTCWNPSVAGLVLGAATDWDEVAELVTESYCLVAPARLSQRAPRPRAAGPRRR
jgi:hypothetical protein